MIDPDAIQIQHTNLPKEITVDTVQEFDFAVYNLEDDKDFKKYISAIKKAIRGSFEYREMVKYLRLHMGMDKCAFIKNVSNDETFDIKIEIHHYPFTLEDIIRIVYRKRCAYNESLFVMMVAKECMILHYRMLVGLISVSETVHQLAHAGRLFIPVDKVLGRYNLFIDYYKPFCEPQQLETIDRIEKYSLENADILDTTILDQTNVTYNVTTDDRFKLPQFDAITDNMFKQLEAIKNNDYMLPTIEDTRKEPYCPIEFIN